jgi:hypothetical protein
MPRSLARGAAAVALATLALGALLYPGALLHGEVFFERDLHHDWYPRMAAVGRALAAGVWPLWEPGLGFGQPLVADPSVQLLYPPTWLVLALPWSAAYTAFVLMHLVVAALGAGRLARRLGAGRLGAAAAALAFALSGPLQSAVNLWHHFAGAAWMPWVLLAADAALRRPRLRRMLAFAAAFALQILAGSADLCAMTLGLVGVMAALRLLRARRRPARLRRAAASLAAALALALALTSALWWPAAESVSRSARKALPEDVRAAWSVPGLGLARLVAPLDPARVPFDAAVWTRLYERPAHPLLPSLYLGIPTLGLAAAAFLSRRRRLGATLLLLVAVVATLFAMGTSGPLYRPLAALLPPVQIFRYPSKTMLVVALAAALLAGLGLRALAGPRRARLALAALVLALACASVLIGRSLGAALGWPLALGAATALVLAAQGARLPLRSASAALLALVVCDLVAAHRELNDTLPAALLTAAPPVLEHVRPPSGQRIHVWDYYTLPGTAERLLGRSDLYLAPEGTSQAQARMLRFAAQRQLLMPATAVFFGLETSYDLDSRGLYPRDLNDLTYFLRYVEGTLAHTRLLRLGAVAKVLAMHERGLEDLKPASTLPSLGGDAIRVFDVPDPRPRAWLVGRTRVADAGEAFRALGDPSWDFVHEALVATGAPLQDGAPLEGSVRWLEYRSDRQRLETTSSREALLVLADSHDPGWRASVDGAPVELKRANLAFRGVVVPAGSHRVELVYRPRALLLGLAVSLSALVACAGLWIAGGVAGGIAGARRAPAPSR